MTMEPDTDPFGEQAPLDEDELSGYAERLEFLPLEEAQWVARVLLECRRARAAEAQLLAQGSAATGQLRDLEHDIARIVLQAAEWLRTLWDVGYMGANRFPAQPRTQFPVVDLEDVLTSALFARIRQGKPPLPFPPPTRNGVPWHDLVEGQGPFVVAAELLRDEKGTPASAVIEACRHWNVVGEPVAGREYIVQHRGKGPFFRLVIASEGSHLVRVPPACTRRIRMRERAGIRCFTLAWPRADGEVESIDLGASTWDRAEAEATYWIALHHPEMYGNVSFEREET
jgi:hypothetical protein